MTWIRIPFTRPRKTGRPEPSGWCKSNDNKCVDTGWYEVDGGLVRQCSCGHVTTVRPFRSPWTDATCSTDNRLSTDFDGCTD